MVGDVDDGMGRTRLEVRGLGGLRVRNIDQMVYVEKKCQVSSAPRYYCPSTVSIHPGVSRGGRARGPRMYRFPNADVADYPLYPSIEPRDVASYLSWRVGEAAG